METETHINKTVEPVKTVPEVFSIYNKKTLYTNAIKFLEDNNIKISTITLDCKLRTLINVDLFAKHVSLRMDQIVSVKYGNRNNPATNRTIVVFKPKKKPSIKNFYNQTTIRMKPTNNPAHNYINIKVFKNGSLQMTGCKDLDDFINVTNRLINILKKGKKIGLKKIQYIDNPSGIGIYDAKIRMINSNFKVAYKIDRKRFANILKTKHGIQTSDKQIGPVEFYYKPTGGHSCVNIKYNYDLNTKVSIFVFQTGAIIITGAKNLYHIAMAYQYICKLLEMYMYEIRIVEVNETDYRKVIELYKKNLSKQNEVKRVECAFN